MLKRSITLEGHRTSLALEPEFWQGLSEIAAVRGISVPRLVVEIDQTRGKAGLASAIRRAVLGYYRSAAERAGAPPRSAVGGPADA